MTGTAALVRVTLATAGGAVISGPAASNLLRLSIREKGGIPFKCGGGICGTCRLLVEQGIEHTDAVKDKERKHLSAEEIAAGYRMACQTFVNGDVRVSWVPMAERKPGARNLPPLPTADR